MITYRTTPYYKETILRSDSEVFYDKPIEKVMIYYTIVIRIKSAQFENSHNFITHKT